MDISDKTNEGGLQVIQGEGQGPVYAADTRTSIQKRLDVLLSDAVLPSLKALMLTEFKEHKEGAPLSKDSAAHQRRVARAVYTLVARSMMEVGFLTTALNENPQLGELMGFAPPAEAVAAPWLSPVQWVDGEEPESEEEPGADSEDEDECEDDEDDGEPGL